MTNTTLVKVLIYVLVESGETGETVTHIVSECSKLVQRKYKRRRDNVARMFHWKLCEKFNLEKSEKWHLQNPQTITENINHKLIWDMNMQCHNVIVEDHIFLLSIRWRRQQ